MSFKSLIVSLVASVSFLGIPMLTVQGSQTVSLSWNPSPDTNVATYVVHYGNTSGSYPIATNVGSQKTAAVGGLQEGQTYFFAVTARDSSGLESLPSNEVSYQVPITSAPAVTLTSPVAGSSYGAPATINCAANVTANGHTITKVQFYNGTTLLGEDTSAPYTFTWSNVSVGGYSFTAKAVYDTGSTVTSSPVSITVASVSAVATLWPGTAVPGLVDNGPDSSAELGVKFRSDVAGSITGIRFYKAAANTGTHVGNLWTSTGTLLATATFTGETASGWQQVLFAAPVAIAANTIYVVSYHANAGHYSVNWNYFSVNGVDNSPLHAPANGVSGGNGVYAYGASSAFPNQTWNAANYWVDVVLQAGAVPTLTSIAVTPANPTIPVAALQQLTATGTYSDGSTQNLTSQTTWTSSGAALATVNASGLATAVSAGTATISAALSGVTGSSTLTVTVNPPTVALSSPTAGAAFTAPATVNCAANVTANSHTITKVQFYNGTTLLGEDTTAPYAFTWSNVSAGSYSVSASVVYDAGTTLASAPVAITVGNQAPTVALSSPTAGAAFTAPATVNCAASVTANSHTITKVQFYNGTTLLGEDTTAPYAFTWSNVGAGSYSVSASVVYDAGTTLASAPAAITVGNQAPTVALSSPTAGAAFTAPATVNCAASVTANGHTITKVQFYNGTTLLGEDTTAPYAFTWSNVSAGSYSVSASVVYDTGTTLASAPASITVGNQAPTVALSSPTAGTAFTAPATINCAANVTANGHIITKVQFYNGTTLLGEDTSAPYTFTWSNVSAGSYSVSASVVYDTGITLASAPANITVNGLPAPWQTVDIGAVGLTGSVSPSNATYIVAGAGTVSGTADSFRFVYQPLSADGEIIVQHSSIGTAGGTNGCIGVMIRESLAPGSRYAFVGVSQDRNFRTQRRTSTARSTTLSITPGTNTPPNIWTRLVRSYNRFDSYTSPDGVNWKKVAGYSLYMATEVYIGMVVASGNTNTLNTSAFSNVSVVP